MGVYTYLQKFRGWKYFSQKVNNSKICNGKQYHKEKKRQFTVSCHPYCRKGAGVCVCVCEGGRGAEKFVMLATMKGPFTEQWPSG